MASLRIVFMGSPEFACPTLSRLAEQYSIVGVVTQPDRPSGRGKQLKPSAVKLLAEKLHIPYIQPARLREEGVFRQLVEWKPDLFVVAAFGQILRQNVLDLPKYGSINVHASLLPRWRGAAPIQASILHGDQTSGVTIMKMDTGIDTGPILAQRAMAIFPDDDAETLGERLARLGADLLIESLPDYLDGKLVPIPQDDKLATYAPMLKKEDGYLDFSQPATQLERQVRAYKPWPGAYFYWKDTQIKVIQAGVDTQLELSPEVHGILDGYPLVGTGEGNLILKVVQPAGKKPMSGVDFLRGARDWIERGYI